MQPGEPAAGPWRVQRLAALVDSLTRRRSGSSTGRPVILAVDGRSSAGKTTLAARIAGHVAASAVVHTDDIAWRHSRFGWADLLTDGILTPLHQGRAVAYRPPRWIEHGRPGCISVPARCPLLIVEGVGAGRSEVTDLIDSLIWVQADSGDADRRSLARIGTPGGPPAAGDLADWMAEEIPFLAAQRTWERAGVIVCGTPHLAHDPARDVVTAPRPGG